MDTKNVIAEISLSAAVIILYGLFFIHDPQIAENKKVINNKNEISKNSEAPSLEQNEEVVLKTGKYGMYITYNGKNSSVKYIKKDYDEITLQDVMDVLKGKKPKNTSIIKEINEEISIRKGKYGPYVFYKTKTMKRPKFISMKGVSKSDITLDWVMNKI